MKDCKHRSSRPSKIQDTSKRNMNMRNTQAVHTMRMRGCHKACFINALCNSQHYRSCSWRHAHVMLMKVALHLALLRTLSPLRILQATLQHHPEPHPRVSKVSHFLELPLSLQPSRLSLPRPPPSWLAKYS
eukprot:scaffold250916_cov33-Tisochrysis_lutea.AAC.1